MFFLAIDHLFLELLDQVILPHILCTEVLDVQIMLLYVLTKVFRVDYSHWVI